MLTRASCFVSRIAVCATLLAWCGSPSAPSPPTSTVPDPPRIACPLPITMVAPGGQPTVVSYGAPTVADGAAPVTVSCAPASGSTFPLGTSPVRCTATDARQRTDTCSFSVVLQMPARIGATRFMAFGDSITLGHDGNPLTLDAFTYPTVILVGREYPTVLQQGLAARYSTQSIQVDNFGSGGEMAGSSAAVARFTNLVSTRSYEVALIMEGTNDMSSGLTSSIAPAISGLRGMILAARVRNVRAYLATIPPMNPEGFRGRHGYLVVPLLNAEIRALAAREGVPLVDVHQAFAGNFGLLAEDGLHPNAHGFAVVAKTFSDVIVATLETAAPAGRPWLVPY